MKVSKYNVIFYCNKKRYVFNTLTCALAEIDDEIASKLSKTTDLNFYGQEDILRKMQASGFVLNDETDELTILKYRNYKNKNANNVFNIIIAPTLQCNFECPYCYETANNKFINDEVKEAIYKKITSLLSIGKDINIVWFGGEPLLAKNIIKEMSEEISQICKKYNKICTFDMSSNGYLLDNSTILDLLKVGVNTIQITIDGPPKIHDSKRKLKGSTSGTFYKIVDNIKVGLKSGMHFRIRVNVDKFNYTSLEKLLKILAKEDLQSCFVHLACVGDYNDYDTNNTITAEEYGQILIGFSNLLKKYGFQHYDDLCYPFSKFSSCSAEVENQLIIDPDGYLYKCIVEIGSIKKSYGNVLNYSDDYSESINNLKYLMISPFERKECVNCKVLPICMGGCALSMLKNKKLDCSHWKYNLEEKLSKICKILK